MQSNISYIVNYVCMVKYRTCSGEKGGDLAQEGIQQHTRLCVELIRLRQVLGHAVLRTRYVNHSVNILSIVLEGCSEQIIQTMRLREMKITTNQKASTPATGTQAARAG